MNVSSSPSEDALLVARPLITMRTGETFSATPATVPHVNYAWSKLERVKYERHPEGPNKIAVAQPNARKPIDHIEPHLLLKTRALDTPRAVHSHCAHYRYNDACVFGAECRFVHAVHLDPNAKPYQKARIRRLDRKGSSATSTGQSNNGSPLDSDQSPTPMQQMASSHHGSSLTAPPAVHPITSGASVDSLPSMSVSFLPPSTMMASAALSQPPAPGFWAPPAPTTHLSRWPPPSQFAAPAYHQPLPPHLHDSLASSGLRVVSPSDSMHGIMLSSTDTAWVPMAAVLANHGGAFNPGQPASALPAQHHLVAPSALQAQPPFWAPTAGHVAAPTFPWGDQQQQQLHH